VSAGGGAHAKGSFMCDPSCLSFRAPDDNGEEVRSGADALCSNECITAPND
jgi:hypothetical protein